LGILNAMPVSLASWRLISFMAAAQTLKNVGCHRCAARPDGPHQRRDERGFLQVDEL
jgi:hypothetical protein